MCSENEQTLEFKLEKIIGIQKHAGKVRKCSFKPGRFKNIISPKVLNCKKFPSRID